MTKIITVLGSLFLLCFHTAFVKADEHNFIVAIDIGHSLEHPGAVSSRGIGEFFFNRSISSKLLAKLKKNGFSQSFLINPDGNNISLEYRTQFAVEKNADILISIHHDSVQPHYLSYWEYEKQRRHYADMFSGHSLFVSTLNKYSYDSYLLAIEIGKAFKENHFSYSAHHAEKIKGENRTLLDDELGIYEFNELIVLKKSQLPTVLVECGVIVNRREEVLLRQPEYQDKLVESLFQGIKNYFSATQS